MSKRGTWGRPSADPVPPEVREACRRMESGEDTDTDWTMSGGWIVCRLWHDATHYEVVIARVEHFGKLVPA